MLRKCISAPKPLKASSSTSKMFSTARASSCPSASPKSAKRFATRSTRATISSEAESSSRWRSSSFAGEKKKEQEAKLNPPYRFMPHVIEPSAGADRFTLAVLCEAYAEDEIGGEARTVMRFHPRLAPIKAAVLPLVNKEGMPEKAEALYRELKREFNVFFDDKGAVGRRYRRQDEAGTPYCFTIDGQTLQDNTVTIRDRDTAQQTRVPINAVMEELRERLRPASSTSHAES